MASKKLRRRRQNDYQQRLHAQCTSKKQYDSELKAWDCAKKLREWGGVPYPLYTYYCKFCKHFHLTKRRTQGLKA